MLQSIRFRRFASRGGWQYMISLEMDQKGRVDPNGLQQVLEELSNSIKTDGLIAHEDAEVSTVRGIKWTMDVNCPEWVTEDRFASVCAEWKQRGRRGFYFQVGIAMMEHYA